MNKKGADKATWIHHTDLSARVLFACSKAKLTRDEAQTIT